MIYACSPQAKGRIERLWETLQDRLVLELRLAGIKSIKEANAFLPGFIKRFNARFAVVPREPQSAYRPLPVCVPACACLPVRVRTQTGTHADRYAQAERKILI